MKPVGFWLDHVAYAYPDGTPAIEDLSLVVEPGERIAILGPNGAGKTTLLLHLNGLVRPSAGTVAIDGLVLDDATVTAVRARVGLVFQDADAQLFMPTVHDDVAFGPANQGLDQTRIETAVDYALGVVEAGNLVDRSPHRLSGGEKRRVALATVLAMDPGLVALDEPTADLDPAARRSLISLLIDLHHTQVIVTHDLFLAAEVCPRSVLIDDGRVVADGSTVDILADHDLLVRHRLELPVPLDREALHQMARIAGQPDLRR